MGDVTFDEHRGGARFDEYLHTLRSKWIELPAGNDQAERQNVSRLLKLPIEDLLAFWKREFAASSWRTWYQNLYAPLFNDARILEIGSGMGFDGLFFIQRGAHWHFCDIIPQNLGLIKRLADAERLCALGYTEITSLSSFKVLPTDFDFIWANSSLLHIPFDLAAEECAAIMPHLKVGGRWIELAYPYERWARDGAPSFSKWGDMTDGDGTPWVEWYDLEKLKQRHYPHKLSSILEYRFLSNQCVWFDLINTGRKISVEVEPVRIPSPGFIKTPGDIWHYAKVISISAYLDGMTGEISADIEFSVSEGAVGFAFFNSDGGVFTGREQVRDAKSVRQRVTITGHSVAADGIVVRNASGAGESAVEIIDITLRSAL